MNIIVPAILLMSSSLLLAACSSSEIVSKEPSRVVVQADDMGDLEDATQRATEYCENLGMRPELERTESAGEGVVSYYNCR